MNEEAKKYNLIMAALVGVVALAGLVINFANGPSGADVVGFPPGEVNPLPIGGNQAWYNYGLNVAQDCAAALTRGNRAYVKNVNQADWSKCTYGLIVPGVGCPQACAGSSDESFCNDMCLSAAEQYYYKTFTIG